METNEVFEARMKREKRKQVNETCPDCESTHTYEIGVAMGRRPNGEAMRLYECGCGTTWKE